MPDVEEHIVEYIRDRSKETQDGIRVPLSRIASELDYSTVTVWRAIQKLKGKRIIKVVKSYNRTEPDKIYYVGESDKITEVLDELIERTNGTLLVLRELKSKIQEKEDEAFKLAKGDVLS